MYLGIPFAQPPVGDLRFVPPQPFQYNTSTINAQLQSPACLQSPTSGYVNYGTSEDCLFLNVYTPAGASAGHSHLPVMVWVYGGSFQSGSASFYNASFLMAEAIESDKPVIIVTVNYRLGILGFGYGEEIAANGAGNLGIKDVISSLEWVQENIWAFGGDPHSVTAFGESAGAIIISLLYLNPTFNLFRAAILESGSQATAPITPVGTDWQGPYDAVVKFSGCSVPNTTLAGNQSTFDCLKALPASVILNATLETVALPMYSGGFIFAPSIDGELIPDSPHTLLGQGKFAHIPFISGDNLDEGTVFTPTYINSTAEVAEIIELVQPRPANSTVLDELLALYPDDPSLGSPFGTGNQTFGLSPEYKRFAAILGDGQFVSQRRWFLEQANKYGLTQTWSYLFTAYTPGAPPYYGSYHGSEVAFVFGVVSTAANYSEADIALSKNMIQYWLNFAYYVDPSGGHSNATHWPEYGSSQTLLQLNGTNTTLIPDTFRRTQTDFFQNEAHAFNAR